MADCLDSSGTGLRTVATATLLSFVANSQLQLFVKPSNQYRSCIIFVLLQGHLSND